MNNERRPAEEALDLLKDAFWQLDSAQRLARGQVEAYVAYLPQRAARSGVRNRFQVVDAAAEEAVAEYLDVVDRFPIAERAKARELTPHINAYRNLEPRVRKAAVEVEEFITAYSAELALVGRELRKVEEQKQAAQQALVSAHSSWEALRNGGLDLSSADQALAKARVAGRGVEGWEPSRGLESLVDTVRLVQGFSADLEKIATEYPDQIARARRRVPSLRTRMDAITTRSARIAEDLRALRREFSMGNWRDLEEQEGRVASEVGRSRGLVARLEQALGAQEWESALNLLAEATAALEAADDAVDLPRERLEALRDFRVDPRARLEKTRFAIKDAQMLVTRGAARATPDMAAHLDSLVVRLDRVPPMLDGVHPDYWAMLTALVAIEREAHDVVQRYRERVR